MSKNVEKELDKKIKKFRIKNLEISISLRLFITAVIILVGAIVLMVYSLVSTKNYKNIYRVGLMEDLEIQSEILAESLKENNFSIDEPKQLGNSIDSLASYFGGRIMVVDSNYKIIKDTYVLQQGAYIINEQVLLSMKSFSTRVNENKDFIEYIYPVIIDNQNIGSIIIIAPTSKINELGDKLYQKNMMIAAIIILLCIIAAIFVGKASVRGINHINKQMEIAIAGHLDNKIQSKGFKEFRQMTEKYNETIDKLMVIDSSRQEFVSNVSHELKTPITSMKVLADSLVENEQADLPMYKEFMSDIVEEIDRETKIINDLLTLVRLDKKSTKPNIEEININDLVEVILKRVTPIAQTRGIEITYESYRDVVAEVDEVKLSLAFTNIIENAVKYNVDNGWVKVTLNADHKNFYVKVADSGVGIPDDCKQQVFERF